jgi:succinate dehydrogenase hydrophobic anchor subunit
MFSQSKQHQLLYFITALLLIMQSLAIWHDAEHPFHVENQQCERFETFANSPTLDIVPHLSVITTAYHAVINVAQPVTLGQSKQRDAYAIRAPPHLIS